MKAINNQNPTLTNIDSVLSRCVNNRNYVYLSANKVIRQKGYFFLLIEKITSLIWTPKIHNDYSPKNVIEKTAADVKNALKDPNVFNLKESDDILKGYNTVKQNLKNISRNVDSLNNRYKLGRITSWRDPFAYLIPTLGGSWQDLSTWINLVLSAPKGIKKIFSLLKACIKTIYCWWNTDYKDKRISAEKEINEANQELQLVIKSWTEKADKLENCINKLDKNNLTKKDLLGAIDLASEYTKDGFPATLMDALFKEKGIDLPSFGSETFGNLLKCLNNPLFPEVLKTPDEESLKNLFSFVNNEKINVDKRSYFLKMVVEKLIAGQLVADHNFELVPLPNDLESRLKLYVDLCDNKHPTSILGKKKEAVIVKNLGEIVPKEVAYVENRGFTDIRGLLNHTGHVKLSSNLLETFSTGILNLTEQKKCQPKEGFIIIISDKPQPSFWEDLIKFANRPDVSHFYLSGTNPIPIPSMDIINIPGFENLLCKMRVTTPIYLPKENEDNRDVLNLLKILCPTLTMKKKGNTELEDYSDKRMHEVQVLLNESSQKIKLPAEATTNHIIWLNHQNDLWGSLTYVDLSLCENLDESILGLKICKPSLENQAVIFPKSLKSKEHLNIDLEPLTDDPVVLRNWLMKEENAVWIPHCLKLYNGIWEYASVFMIPIANSGKLKEACCPKEWTHMDPCSVSLWMYEDSYKNMPKNEIIEINAYHNGNLKNENVEEFLDKFPKARKVCLTGTSVNAEKVKSLKEKYTDITFFFEVEEMPDPLYSLTTESVVEEFKTAKGLDLQKCHLFMETFCPEKMEFRGVRIVNFENFEIVLKNEKLTFNRFIVIKNNPDLEDLLSLGGDFCFQDKIAYESEGMSVDIANIFKSYLVQGNTELPELAEGGWAYIEYIDEMERLFYFAIEMKLMKFAKIVLNGLPDIIQAINLLNNEKNTAIEKTLESLKNICTKAYANKFYEESSILMNKFLLVSPNSKTNIKELQQDLNQLKQINEEDEKNKK